MDFPQGLKAKQFEKGTLLLSNGDVAKLFPGLVVPMHFFPAVAYFTIAPFFQTK